MTTVSVIIPNYNRACLLGETIHNMLNQSLVPLEVIVVDDGSTDHSIDVIQSFGNRVRLVQQSNQGPGAARNAGLSIATGEYVQFMDSDDLASLNKLEYQFLSLEKTRADIAYSPWAKVHIQDSILQFEDCVLQDQALSSNKSMLMWFLSGWSIVLQSCLFRRSLLKKAGFFHTNLMIWEDGEYFVRILLEDPQIVFVSGCLTLYRLHNINKLTENGSSSECKLRNRVNVFPIIASYLKEHDIVLDRSTKLNFSIVLWKLYREMNASKTFSTKENLEILALCEYPIILMIFFSLIRRLINYLNWLIYKSRWSPAYQSVKPNHSHITLIEHMGFICKR